MTCCCWFDKLVLVEKNEFLLLSYSKSNPNHVNLRVGF